MTPPLDPIARPPLERASALSAVLTSAEQQHHVLSSLRQVAEEHALAVHRFVLAVSRGADPDPALILRSRGRVEALVQELLAEHAGEGLAWEELRLAFVEHPDADLELEARAMAALRARLGQAEAATSVGTPVAGPEGLK